MADVAEPLAVELIVEPVNRYEVNFINNCDEGLEVVKQSGRPCVKLMPDLFHMNIEDASFRHAFEAAKAYISYIHVADTTAGPGLGTLPFDEIFRIVDGIVTTVIYGDVLPRPTPPSRGPGDHVPAAQIPIQSVP